jgi:hypothetical protein
MHIEETRRARLWLVAAAAGVALLTILVLFAGGGSAY